MGASQEKLRSNTDSSALDVSADGRGNGPMQVVLACASTDTIVHCAYMVQIGLVSATFDHSVPGYNLATDNLNP